MQKELEIIKAGYTLLMTTHPAATKATIAHLRSNGWVTFKTLPTVNGTVIYGKKN